MSFLISALPKAQFEHLPRMSDEELASLHAVRMVATQKPGFPCRVSLADADIGEEVILSNFEHQDAATPFRSSHAVYVRPNQAQAQLNIDEVPALLRTRKLSLRGFGDDGMMTMADLADGMEVEQVIESFFASPTVVYIHVHFVPTASSSIILDATMMRTEK